MATIDITAVLDYSGEDTLEDVTELILRGGKFTAFDEAVARRLSQLQLLSLSHNLFSSLSSCSALESLVELNLNFNQLTSLDGLECPRLERLYLSNNRLGSIEELCGFNCLTTVCLYHNSLLDLSATVSVLRTLPKLRTLDVAGNPCTRDAGAHHELVMQLPRVKQLDGEAVSALDRDLAEMYFVKHARRAKAKAARPSTAPSSGGSQSGMRGLDSAPLSRDSQLFRSSDLNDNATVIDYLARAAVADPFATGNSSRASSPMDDDTADQQVPTTNAQPAPRLPKSRGAGSAKPHGKRGARSGPLPRPKSLRRLGSDSSLTLAGDRPPLPSPLAASPTASGGGGNSSSFTSAPQSSSAVGRLRGMRRSRPSSTGSTGSEGLGDAHDAAGANSGGDTSGRRPPRPRARSGSGAADGPESGGNAVPALAVATVRRGSSGGGGGGPALVTPRTSKRLGLDPSDPHVTIRKLLKTIEVLQSERSQLQKTVSNLTGGLSDANAGSDADVVALAASGISWKDLVRENQELRSENANMYILKEENEALNRRVTQLLRQLDDNAVILENKRLKSELREVKEKLHRANRQPMASSLPLQRPQTPAEVIADVEDFDAELAALIKRNQSTMAGIKRDLNAAKREAWTSARAGARAAAAPGSPGGPQYNRPPPTPPGRRRHASDNSGRVSPRRGLSGRRYKEVGVAGAGSGTGASAGAGAGVGVTAGGEGAAGQAGVPAMPDPHAFRVRPGTPNLLGREISSTADVQAAYEAVAAAQARRAELDASRALLLSARGGRPATAPRPDGSAPGATYATRTQHTAGADIMTFDEVAADGSGDESDDASYTSCDESDEQDQLGDSSGAAADGV